MITVREVDPNVEDLRYLDGPWSNAACRGYTLMAMQRTGLDNESIRKVMRELTECFDDTAVKEAEQHYFNSSF